MTTSTFRDSFGLLAQALEGFDEECRAFFGVPFQKLDVHIRGFFLRHRKALPDVMRSTRKLSEMPRWDRSLTDNRISAPPLRRVTEEQILWILENTHGKWRWDERAFYFSDVKDAVMYQLVWG